MAYSFFAMLSRMKDIRRWALMRNTRPENISEHSHEVAVLAHALALLTNAHYGGQVDPDRCVTMAVYHDVPEILTGDMPTPVKYYSPAIREAYRQLEREQHVRTGWLVVITPYPRAAVCKMDIVKRDLAYCFGKLGLLGTSES